MTNFENNQAEKREENNQWYIPIGVSHVSCYIKLFYIKKLQNVTVEKKMS